MKLGDTRDPVTPLRLAFRYTAERRTPDAADLDPPDFAPRLAGGGAKRQRRHTLQARHPGQGLLPRFHGDQQLAVGDADLLAQDGLTVEERYLERQGAFLRRLSVNRRRDPPVEVEFDAALDAHERGEAAALPARRRAAAIRRLQPRQLQRAGQQTAVPDARHDPAFAVDLDDTRRGVERDLQAVHGGRRAAHHHDVPSRRYAQPQSSVAGSQDLRRSGPVQRDPLRAPALLRPGERNGDVLGGVHRQGHLDTVAPRLHVGRGNLGAARHAVGRFEEPRLEFAQ